MGHTVNLDCDPDDRAGLQAAAFRSHCQQISKVLEQLAPVSLALEAQKSPGEPSAVGLGQVWQFSGMYCPNSDAKPSSYKRTYIVVGDRQAKLIAAQGVPSILGVVSNLSLFDKPRHADWRLLSDEEARTAAQVFARWEAEQAAANDPAEVHRALEQSYALLLRDLNAVARCVTQYWPTECDKDCDKQPGPLDNAARVAVRVLTLAADWKRRADREAASTTRAAGLADLCGNLERQLSRKREQCDEQADRILRLQEQIDALKRRR